MTRRWVGRDHRDDGNPMFGLLVATIASAPVWALVWLVLR